MSSNPALLWVTFSVGGHRRNLAATAEGVYDVDPCFKTVKRKHTFVGYRVRYVTVHRDSAEFDDNLDLADDEDIRLLKTDMLNETEAKAIAQADFNQDLRA